MTNLRLLCMPDLKGSDGTLPLEGKRLAGAHVDASAALDAEVGVNLGDFLDGQCLAGARIGASAA